MSDFRNVLYERYVSTYKIEAQSTTSDKGSYFEWCRHRYLPLIDELPRDSHILELGCGPGDMLQFLRKSGFTAVEGVDVSAEQVQIALGHGLNARVADVFDCLGSAPHRYRAIIAIDFLEHFSKDELMRLVPAIRGALEPGGMLIVTTPNGQGLFPNQVVHGDLTHMTIFTPDSLTQLLRLWNFGEIRFHECGPVPANLKGRFRTFAWRMIRAAANLARKIETGKTQAIWTETMICRCSRTAD